MITPEDALERLKEGNDRFVAGNNAILRFNSTRMNETLLEGQSPFAAVLTCSDSRVPVEVIFDQGIGDLFVIRVAGNVCDVIETGSVEFGIGFLETPIFVVLGHRDCGAVAAVVNDVQLQGSIPAILDRIRPAGQRAKKSGKSGDELLKNAIVENVFQSIGDLFGQSPSARERVKNGTLKVVGAVYDIVSGKVTWLGEHPDQGTLVSR